MLNTQVKTDDLQANPLFRTLNDAQLHLVAENMIRRVYTPGQLIFLEGEDSIGLWFILQGRVKILKHSLTGRLQGLCVVNKGKCFGGCPLFDVETNPADAQALDEVTLAVLPRDRLRHIIQQDAQIARQLIHIFNDRTQLLARLGESLGSWSVPLRINDYLIANAVQEEDSLPIVHLTHEEIAVLVGTAREVVSRHLATLEKSDLIQTNPGVITILDKMALQASCIAHQGTSSS